MSAAVDRQHERKLFEAPLLKGLNERDRQTVLRTVRFDPLEGGELVYAESAIADSLFVVVRGAVELVGRRRGDTEPTVIRVVRAGESFGEDALILGGVRRLEARAESDAEVAEIPVAVLERAIARSGTEATLARELRFTERSVISDLLRTVAFARKLPDVDFEMLLDGAARRSVERGMRVFSAGDDADTFFLVLEGLIQLQRVEEGVPEVRAYLGNGDFFGDEEIFTGDERRLDAVAAGPSELVAVPAEVLRSLSDRNPRLLERVRRIHTERASAQGSALAETDTGSTQHVLRDVYRMQMARSLLVIDQDSCVRCGHCAWTCESVHGVSRLVRRGDKVVTALRTLDGADDAGASSLMLPSSCQHCKNPACMVDCPTGAIGRDPEGEVFIREELCIGCGNCAKACPWDNIRMAARPEGSRVAESLQAHPEIAVKCDLCREQEAPACVSACPTQSIFRLEPSRDFREVEALFGSGAEAPTDGAGSGPSARRDGGALGVGLASGLALGLSLAAGLAHRTGVLGPGHGVGLAAGWLALGLVVSLALYSVPKRMLGRWLKSRPEKKRSRRSEERAPAKSRVRPFYRAHLAVGALSIAAVLAHAGPAPSANVSGALGLAFFLVAGLGALGGLLYRFVPSRLARLERKGTLPEDMRAERDALLDRLHLEASGRSELLKRVLERVLLPYARSSWGPFALALSGRSRHEEEARVRAEIEALLEGRGADKLEGLDELVRTVVEMQTLPARAWLERGLRGWLVPHIVLTGVLGALLVLHLLVVLGG